VLVAARPPGDVTREFHHAPVPFVHLMHSLISVSDYPDIPHFAPDSFRGIDILCFFGVFVCNSSYYEVF